MNRLQGHWVTGRSHVSGEDTRNGKAVGLPSTCHCMRLGWAVVVWLNVQSGHSKVAGYSTVAELCGCDQGSLKNEPGKHSVICDAVVAQIEHHM